MYYEQMLTDVNREKDDGEEDRVHQHRIFNIDNIIKAYMERKRWLICPRGQKNLTWKQTVFFSLLFFPTVPYNGFIYSKYSILVKLIMIKRNSER